MPGQAAKRADISSITNASPCEITTSAAHGFSSLDVVRLTDLNGNIPVARGMDPLNRLSWEIVVTGSTTFTLRDPITHEDIDSTGYTAYVSGGYCNQIATQFTYSGD